MPSADSDATGASPLQCAKAHISPYTYQQVKTYYHGLPSQPNFVASSNTEVWAPPTGPEAYMLVKMLRPVGEHKIVELWEAGLADQVIDRLTAMKVEWTSLDVVRIGTVGESSAPPIILWIGVVPESLSGENGHAVALDARKVLYDKGIEDIEVEIRESRVFKSVGPKLLTPIFSSNSLATVADPLTVTLGLPICADERRDAEGTGGFYVAKSGVPDKVFLVTARHVISPPSLEDNGTIEYKSTSQPRHKVTVLGDAAYKNLVSSIMGEIALMVMTAEHQEARREAVEEEEGDDAKTVRAEAERRLGAAKKAIVRLSAFYKEVVSKWANPAERILGHVVLAPPLNFSVGPLGFIQDIAIIEVDQAKIDATNFRGNVIDLGTEINSAEFAFRMYPDARSRTHFKYPTDRLLKLSDTISIDEMRHPQVVDEDGEKCIMVLKNGGNTGRTIGRANTIFSYTRHHFENSPGIISKEWAILPVDRKSGPFSAPGDSGSVIVDGRGRFGGLLTGGSGATETPDITYATPISIVLECLGDFGFKANFNLPFVAQ
jgi:hypothetical protein